MSPTAGPVMRGPGRLAASRPARRRGARRGRMGKPASREDPDAARRPERSGLRSGSWSARCWAVRSCSSVEHRADLIKIPPEGMVVYGAYETAFALVTGAGEVG
jgi:hypothetical protein